MAKKPIAWLYEDKDGVCAQYCKTKEEARKVMQQEVDSEINDERDPEDEDFADPPIVIDIESIKETSAYASHRKCDSGFYIGEAMCWGCGETTNARPQKVFTFDF